MPDTRKPRRPEAPMAPAPVAPVHAKPVHAEPAQTAPDAEPATPRVLPPEAQRALAEAEARRAAASGAALPTELGGRNGPEPVRYGDWEKNGLAIDF